MKDKTLKEIAITGVSFVVVMFVIVGVGKAIVEQIHEEVFICDEVCSSIHNHTMNYSDAKESCRGFTVKMYDKCYKEGIIEWVGLS